MSPKAALANLDFELVLEDGVPLETHYHQLQMVLFLELVRRRLTELGRDDFFAGGNMFVYYSPEQAQAVAEEERQLALFENGFRPEPPKKVAYRGPDAFLVKGADPRRERHVWVVWEEDGRFPDLVLELLSPSTAAYDHGEKKRIYERIFKTSEYFLYQPRSQQVEGFRLFDNSYQRITPGPQRRLWSRELEVEWGYGTESTVARRDSGCVCSIPTVDWCQRRKNGLARSVNAPTPPRQSSRVFAPASPSSRVDRGCFASLAGLLYSRLAPPSGRGRNAVGTTASAVTRTSPAVARRPPWPRADRPRRRRG